MNRKSYFHITVEQRYEIDSLLKAGNKISFIARQTGIHRSSIYREINRNSGKNGYFAKHANQLANERKERFGRKRKFTLKVKEFIDKKINDDWSPEQINGYCKKEGIPMVSHESIYQYIYWDKQKGGYLYKHLRIASKKYRKRYGTYDKRGIIKDRVWIDQRPDIVDRKERFGDWEADTIIGKNQKGAIVTIVERKSLFSLMANLKGKKSDYLRKELINLLAPYKEKVFTITSDNGFEFSQHKTIAKKLGIDFFFAHPYSSWERGVNENTNGLIRQYIPKKSSFENISTEFLNLVMSKLNNRPRKSLGYKTPLNVFLSNFNP